MSNVKDAKEQAYVYDLYVVPQWRENFDQLLDDKLAFPAEGRILDAACGTGGYALELAVRGDAKVEIVGLDDNAERIALAHGKLEIKQLENISFTQGTLENSGLRTEDFDFVIVDVSLLPPPELTERLPQILKEMRRVTKAGGQIVLKIATRGSFDEFYSYYWQALYELGWESFTPEIETLTKERYAVEEIENVVRAAGFRRIESHTEKQRFDYATAQDFVSAPLIETIFMPRWLAILPAAKQPEIIAQLQKIIEQERADFVFEVSAKLTLVTAER